MNPEVPSATRSASPLLDRIATTLRGDVGPAVEGEYPRTQAFMAAVVLEKLARQVALAADHQQADREDRRALARDLAGLLDRADTPATLHEVVEAAGPEPADAELCRLVEALYRHRSELGADRFDTVLGRVRRTLRAQIDRRMAVAS